MVHWTDRSGQAECYIAQLGMSKAGVNVVSFDESLNQEALEHALRSTKAKGLFFSPQMTISDDCVQRSDILLNTFPELNSMYAG